MHAGVLVRTRAGAAIHFLNRRGARDGRRRRESFWFGLAPHPSTLTSRQGVLGIGGFGLQHTHPDSGDIMASSPHGNDRPSLGLGWLNGGLGLAGKCGLSFSSLAQGGKFWGSCVLWWILRGDRDGEEEENKTAQNDSPAGARDKP